MSVWPRAGAAAVLGALVVAVAHVAGAAGPSPYWLRDGYTDLARVDLTGTTAQVDTSGTGTVRLPYAPVEAAFDPAGTYALVATQGGVYAYVFNGQAVRVAPGWGLDRLDAVGVTWLNDGGAFAVATAQQIAVYGLSAKDGQLAAVRAVTAPATGVVDIAPGPGSLPFALVAGTAAGVQLYDAAGGALQAIPGAPGALVGNRGVAATADGRVLATWQSEAVELWAWDGARYLPAASWDPPTPAARDGPVVGVAFFPQGGGYWVLTGQGQVLAYAYGPWGEIALDAASLSAPAVPAPPLGLASGWQAGSAAVVYPWGWAYADLGSKRVFAVDAARGLTGQVWPAYASSGVLESIPAVVGHLVTELRVEDADCPAGERPPRCGGLARVPAGTSIQYAVGADGCNALTATPPFRVVSVAAGDRLCYRLTLRTADPTATPVVDVTNLYEIAAQILSSHAVALLCAGAACGPG